MPETKGDYGRHVITVKGWVMHCTCDFKDMAGQLSVMNHAATHNPPASVRVLPDSSLGDAARARGAEIHHPPSRTPYGAGDPDVTHSDTGEPYRGGLPVHLPMLVTVTGDGPCSVGDEDAHHWTCWCGDDDCVWAVALIANFAMGRL